MQHLARFVVANDANRPYFGPELAESGEHEPRAAQPILFTRIAEHGNGGFRTDPVGRAENVSVHHEVADEYHPALWQVLDELDRRVLPASRRLVRVAPTSLSEDAPLLGAAELAFEPLLNDPAAWLRPRQLAVARPA